MKTKINSILYVRLKCPEIYPAGVIYLADYIHKKRPHVEQFVLDMVGVPLKDETAVLLEEIGRRNPDAVAFSWRNLQPYSPNEGDDSLLQAFTFYHSTNPAKKAKAALAGARRVMGYNNGIKRNLALMHAVKNSFPDTQIIAGGPAFGIFLDLITAKAPEGTMAVAGEGERFLLKLIDGQDVSDERSAVVRDGKLALGQKSGYFDLWNESTPLDFAYLETIFPDFSYYMQDRFRDFYEVSVLTKRGCPYKCMFCIYGKIDGYKVRFRRPEVVVDEIEALVDRYGVKKLWFCDSQFYPSRHSLPLVERTLDGIIDRRLDVRWTSYLRVDNITPDLADKFVVSGLRHLRLSITSGCPAIIKNLKIGLRLEKFYKACRLLAEAGYEGTINLDLSLNAPGETPATILETIDTVERVASIFKPGQVKPFIIFLAVQPGTELAEHSVSQGYLSPDFNPLALTPFSIKGLIHNPPPLGKPIGKAVINAMENQPDDVGWTVLKELKQRFSP
jgi:radical SAM superfamily enzyme YgiQ (UPF0313 family)